MMYSFLKGHHAVAISLFKCGDCRTLTVILQEKAVIQGQFKQLQESL
jgi:hypothetical protein